MNNEPAGSGSLVTLHYEQTKEQSAKIISFPF